jgi:formate dehydrogenase gamma subunit
MRRYFVVALLLASLFVCVTLLLDGFRAVNAQANKGSPETPITPNQGAIIGGREAAASPAPSGGLQCQGCHGPGTKLPYLAGSLFHTGPHKDYDHSFHAQAISNGNRAATCLDCHTNNRDMTTILPASDPRSTINRSNVADTCGRCHGDKSVMQGSGISNQPFLSYRESVHAIAISRGNLKAAVCTDCHNSHNIEPASNSQSSIAKVNIPTTCGKCHAAEATEFMQSIHGQAVARGVSRSPACTDCHGIHNILVPVDHETRAPTTALGTDSCAKCHEGVTLTQEFGIAGERVSSYKESYHGLASQFGSKVVANCASCHGVHNILPSSDPRSMISAPNLSRTCGQCHVGASANFATGKVHLTSGVAAPDLGVRGTRIVRWIYIPLIVLTIGGMAIHNVLVWRKKTSHKRHQLRTIVRLTSNQRLQHWLLLTSFIALVLSGFALQYPDSWLASLLGGSEALRRVIHRIAAVVMLIVGGYHIAYLVLSTEGKHWVRDMIPTWKDVKDLQENMAFYLGRRSQKPAIARFGYAEKAEYWAVIWGTLIMGLTGLMIWFKISLFGFLPRGWIDIALAIHFYEAVLATLAIVVWHFYHVIFDPDVYPLNWALVDGRVSEDLYKEEHELDYYERLKQQAMPVSSAEVSGPDGEILNEESPISEPAIDVVAQTPIKQTSNDG